MPAKIRHMVSREVTAFLAAKRGRKLSQNTTIFYDNLLTPFLEWCERNKILYMDGITHEVITEYLSYCDPNHNRGGLFKIYSVIKTFLRWYDWTAEPANWKNPINKVDPPRRSNQPIQGVTADDFRRMIAQCRSDYYGVRDKAIMSFLYDTGVRVTELCNILMSQIDIKTGTAFIEHGKGDKARFVFFGNTCRVELNRYFRKRADNGGHLFTSIRGEQMKREAIRSLLLKYANLAGLTELPSPHDFRRAWVHETRKRAGDLTTSRVAGHSNTSLLRIYDYQSPADLAEAIAGSSPLDNLKRK